MCISRLKTLNPTGCFYHLLYNRCNVFYCNVSFCLVKNGKSALQATTWLMVPTKFLRKQTAFNRSFENESFSFCKIRRKEYKVRCFQRKHPTCKHREQSLLGVMNISKGTQECGNGLHFRKLSKTRTTRKYAFNPTLPEGLNIQTCVFYAGHQNSNVLCLKDTLKNDPSYPIGKLLCRNTMMDICFCSAFVSFFLYGGKLNHHTRSVVLQRT